MISILDLFSGIGGFSLAGKWCGFETIQFVEKDEFCQKVLMKNFPGIPIHDDIKTFNYCNKVNLLTGGFPCQPFSIAGKRKGILDERYLWNEMLRVIRQSNPNWIIAENVSGIVEMELDNIINDLEGEGYKAKSFIIPACAANAPHRRDRLWIIANLNEFRCDNGITYWKERSIQDNKKWDIEKIQSEWEKLKPISWKTNKAEDWFQYNARIGRGNNGISNRVHRIKSLGNAIVPQVAYPIMKFIYDCETSMENVCHSK